MGSFWVTDHAQNRDSRIFWKSKVIIMNQKSDLARNDLHTKLTPVTRVFVIYSSFLKFESGTSQMECL